MCGRAQREQAHTPADMSGRCGRSVNPQQYLPATSTARSRRHPVRGGVASQQVMDEDRRCRCFSRRRVHVRSASTWRASGRTPSSIEATSPRCSSPTNNAAAATSSSSRSTIARPFSSSTDTNKPPSCSTSCGRPQPSSGAFDPEGVAVWQNNGIPAYQSVPHLNFHVAGTLPDGGTEWGDVLALRVAQTDAIADQLRPHLPDPS